MEFGIVSNCWKTQLDGGTPLVELVAEAVRRGYNYVELRQGCLGGCERKSDGGTIPDPAAMAGLPERFPGVGFNLALAMPFFGGEVGPDDPLFRVGLEASGALAMGGIRAAHLRLVDPETPADALVGQSVERLSDGLAALASACGARGGMLSVENARQSWALLRRVFEQARARLGPRAPALGLCYDPCNLLGAADRPDPQAETARLRADEIALFHFKQSRSGTPYPEVASGEIDWEAQLASLRDLGYDGPRLFEIPPGPDIWERLDRSREYLNTLEKA